MLVEKPFFQKNKNKEIKQINKIINIKVYIVNIYMHEFRLNESVLD